MKKIFLFLIIISAVFTFSSCSGDENVTTTAPFTLKSSEELQGVAPTGFETTGDEKNPTRIIYSDAYKASDVRSFFLDVVFGSSNIRKTKNERLEKWAIPIKYYFTGRYTKTDEEAVENLARTLNGIDGFPGIDKASSKNDANLIIAYGAYNYENETLSDTNTAVSYTESIYNKGEINSAGIFNCKDNFGEIYEAEIEIAVGNASDKQRSQAVSKEIMRICGMPFSSEVFSESIFCENPNITGYPSEIDLIAFELLYSSKLHGSITFPECYYILDNLLS